MKKFDSMLIAAQNALANKSAETYVDTGVKVLIAVIIGALLLAGLFELFDLVVVPELTRVVNELFNTADGINDTLGKTNTPAIDAI